MKILYLLRHGKAEAGDEDFERELSPQGERDVERMGRHLYERRVRPNIVYCSTAPRARRTAEILLPIMDVELNSVRFEEFLYLASPDRLQEFVAGFAEDYESALICGHNPGLEHLATLYLNRVAGSFPTSAFREILFNADSWATVDIDTVMQTTLITPKDL